MMNRIKQYKPFIDSDFFNIGPIVSFIWNNDATWSVFSVSKNIKDNFGYDTKQFINGEIQYSSLIHQDDIEEVSKEVSIAIEKKLKSFVHKPYRLKNINNDYRWVQDTTTIIYDEKGDIVYFVGYILDITENENNLLKIKEKEEKLEVAQSLAHIGNWELDLNTNELYWSDEIYRLFELDKNRFKPSYETFLDVIHPKDRDLVNDAYLNSLQTKEKYTIQHRLLLPHNKIKYVEEKCESYFDEDGKAYRSVGTVQDITIQKEIELQLEKTLSFLKSYKLAIDESSMVSKSDLKGNITYVNDNFCKVTKYTQDEVLGKPHSIIRHPDNPKEIFKELWDTIQSKKVWKKLLKNIDKYGKDYWINTTVLPILDDKNNIVEYIAVRHDITKMIDQQNKLDNIANTDTLTGLGNRYKLLGDIKNSNNPALAIINLDNFSQINDFYGHEIGDFVIKEFGRNLSRLHKNTNYLTYHLQGDEYVIFKQNTTKEIFLDHLNKLKSDLLKINIFIKDEPTILNFSISVSFEGKQKILTTADMALKVAKINHEEFIVYSDEISLEKEYENNIKWTKKIKEAIANDAITPVFQPIVNNKTNNWEKYESLVRIQDEDKLISPYFFLDIAKKTKHYTQITKIMLEKSFEKFSTNNFDFSVNLTIEDILNEDIKNFIFEMLEKYQIGSRVVFEIVESEYIENFDMVLSFIEGVKQYNCKIAIDDFGTGYSNFEYLLKLKVDFIKIDGSMIKDIDTNQDAQLVVSTIIDFAKKLNIKTIGEFVENEKILETIKKLGIDYSQGYHFSAPKLDLN